MKNIFVLKNGNNSTEPPVVSSRLEKQSFWNPESNNESLFQSGKLGQLEAIQYFLFCIIQKYYNS